MVTENRYTLEAYAAPHYLSPNGFFVPPIEFTDLNRLRREVFEAFMGGHPNVWVTYRGVRKAITTCAQFDQEYICRKVS